MRKLVGALDAGVADMANFFGVEKFPLFVVKFGVEVDDESGVDEVEKRIAHIAIILENERKSTL